MVVEKALFKRQKQRFHNMDVIISVGYRVNKRPVLAGKGQVSTEQAKEHALDELKKFKERRLSPAEEDYMETIRVLNAKAKKGIGKK